MTARNWPVPGWNEHSRLPAWFASVFQPELINYVDDWRDFHRDNVLLRESFEYILERQPFSISDWYDLTKWMFYAEGELYGYLLQVYEYYYLGSDRIPTLPDEHRPKPDSYGPPWVSFLDPTPCDIPGWCESEEIREFYLWAFHPKVIKHLYMYDLWARERPLVRAGLRYLIEEKPFSVRDWKLFTQSEFASEAELYAFLVDLYEYFYDEEPPRHAPA
ncbi:hypothetical protein CFP65_3846 [Kitasatospora sp. MMS16-BH015]|uniref:hypothetical protein n=1 Tax=Kitasatospora sp. MMS16-BH015 TaxID=2018025 RepID=UPI000CA16C2D|nr:hypothetical protein [Kitasatospora sp. MMS16-BH015]AUG78626.1 hypothetical protein CFP65_3846 [Kitasatospora sp. MMS16-BH015]